MGTCLAAECEKSWVTQKNDGTGFSEPKHADKIQSPQNPNMEAPEKLVSNLSFLKLSANMSACLHPFPGAAP